MNSGAGDGSFAPLLQAATHGTLLVFAGAGISMRPPSCLPDWKGFNRALIEAVKSSALRAPGLPEPAAAAIRRLDVEHLAVEGVSDAVVSSLAGESYFPLLTVLDSEETNVYHDAVAELARRGACRVVVTTNFDRLLERALDRHGLSPDVVSAPEDFRRDQRASPAVFKIHGSVTDSTTIVDTVSQKLRGLSFPVRARLRELFQRHHVLVVGFSGADLAFGSDYLALSALKAGIAGITWVVEPGRALRPEAAATLRAARGVCLEATLSDVFTRLGVPVPAPSAAAADGRAPGQAEADARAEARIGNWLEGLGGGPLMALLFCTELFDELGWRAEANSLRAALTSTLEGRTTLPISAIRAFNLLSIGADEVGDYRNCEYWARRVLAMCAQFERLRQGVPVSPAGLREMSGQRIVGWIQMGRARAGLGDTSSAREAYAHAHRAVESIGDRTRQSALLMNEVLLLKREKRSIEEQITLSRRAWAMAAANGSAQIMTESALIEAHTLATIGEYDGAFEALARAERAVRWSGSLLTRLSPQLLRAELAARRGHPDQAADEFDRSIVLAATDPVVEARVRLVTVATLAFHPPFLARALAHLDQVLAAMAEARIPRDGTNAHLASEDDIRQLPARVRDIAAVGVPGFLAVPDGVSSSEQGLRGTLLNAEYEGDAGTVAQILWRLANGRYDAARPRRMHDLAEAALQAAERAGDQPARIAALLLAGIARDLSGNFQGAMDASRAVIDAQPSAPEELRIRASQNLGVVLTRAGRAGEAVPLIRAALDHHRSTRDADATARSIMALADTLASAGDRAGALAVLEQGAREIEATSDMLAIGKRDAMRTSLLADRGGSRPGPMLFGGREMAVTAEEIERLRRQSESPEESCDIAALALGGGLVRAAINLVLEAQASFHRGQDAGGLARCFHLLADAAQLEGRWDNALDFTRHALALEEDVQDEQGQTGSYGALALQFVEVGRFDGAEWAATACLTRAGPVGRSRFTVIARYALAEVYRRAERTRLSREEARLARQEMDESSDLPPRSMLRRWLEPRLKAFTRRRVVWSWLSSLAR